VGGCVMADGHTSNLACPLIGAAVAKFLLATGTDVILEVATLEEEEMQVKQRLVNILML
jgi:hypothetical protein